MVAPAGDDWLRIGELVTRYADLGLGGSDASIVALAERSGTDLIVSFDHRHLADVRSRAGTPFRLIPA